MHQVGYVLSSQFQVMAIATQAVFEFANNVMGEPFYAIQNYSLAGGLTRSSLGMSIETLPLAESGQVDTWVVAGVSEPLDLKPEPGVLAFLGNDATRARRIAGICTGSFVLADAGLLASRRATTHWVYAEDLRRQHPEVLVEPDRIYIVDGPIWTSAGMTAGLDLALAMVEKDLGNDMARSVAHKLVMHQHRAGGQSQHSELLNLSPKTDRIQNAINYARQHLASPLTVEILADAANLSARQFTRVFTSETGQSPAKAIESLRLEAARLMIEQSRHSLEIIARETGFRDRRHLREAFLRGFGISPQTLRRGVDD